MKTLHTLALLCSAVLLCGASPTPMPVTCSQDSFAAAANLAMYRINENHHHGYKFKLSEIKGSTMEQVGNGCNIELHLDLNETMCHHENPKHFDECATRSESSRAVVANCTVMMSVIAGETTVKKYECDTRQEKTNVEMMTDCPDCPILLSLRDAEGVRSIELAVDSFNKNTSNAHLYILHEVGRISSSYMFDLGLGYNSEFVVVETDCPRESRIAVQACKPRCDDKAHHAFCRSFYTQVQGLSSVDCDFYPPVDTAPVEPGTIPMCRRSFGIHPARPGGLKTPAPSDDAPPPPPVGHGPPAPPFGHGPPPHPHGPPGHNRRVHPHLPFHPCHAMMTKSDPAIHPICPFPPLDMGPPRQSEI